MQIIENVNFYIMKNILLKEKKNYICKFKIIFVFS